MTTDPYAMWSRRCPTCGTTEYTDEHTAGKPRSLSGACPECSTVHDTPWRDADEPHPALWQTINNQPQENNQ